LTRKNSSFKVSVCKENIRNVLILFDILDNGYCRKRVLSVLCSAWRFFKQRFSVVALTGYFHIEGERKIVLSVRFPEEYDLLGCNAV
jgi:hypothetical protein